MAKAATLNIDIVATADKAVETFDKVKEKASTSSAAMKVGPWSAPPPRFWPRLGDATKAAADHQVVVAKRRPGVQGRRRTHHRHARLPGGD